MVSVEESQQVVLYRGREFVKTETDTETILTSISNGKSKKRSVLVFTKDIALSESSKNTARGMIKQSIIANYQTKQG